MGMAALDRFALSSRRRLGARRRVDRAEPFPSGQPATDSGIEYVDCQVKIGADSGCARPRGTAACSGRRLNLRRGAAG